jgi:hypothetical protein
MAVAHESATESHTGTTGSANQASFDISVPFTASTKGLLVFTFVNANAADALSVKIDPAGANTDVPAVDFGEAVDSAGEPGRCKAWFLGSGLPTATTTVRINRTNNGNVMYAVAITVTAGGGTGALGVLKIEGDGTLVEQSVDDGSPGTNSVRYAGVNSGLAAVPAAGASSTVLHGIDFGTRVIQTVRETTAGQGARNVGFSSGTSDDRAAVHLAIKEVGPADFPLNAEPGSYAVTGVTATPLASRLVDAAAGAYALTGLDAGVFRGFPLNAESGAYALTGAGAGILATRLLDANPGVYALTGIAATVVVGRVLAGDAGVYVLTGLDATLQGPVGAFVLVADPGSYALTGAVAAILAQRILTADPGAYFITGQLAALVASRVVSADPGVYALIGAEAALLAQRLLSADPGTYGLTGEQASVLAARLLSGEVGVYVLTGAVADLIYATTGYVLNAETGIYVLTGAAAELFLPERIAHGPVDAITGDTRRYADVDDTKVQH